MFGMSYGFDDKPVVSGEIKKRPGFSGGAQFRKNVFRGER